MNVEEIVERIYDFEGNTEEWLGFEKEVQEEIAGYSGQDLEYLEESDAMEHLLMVCDGIRYGKG